MIIRILLLFLCCAAIFFAGTQTARLVENKDMVRVIPSVTSAMRSAFKAAETKLRSTPPSDHENLRLPDALLASRSRLQKLPMSGTAWERLLHAANAPFGFPSIAEKDNEAGVLTLAKALAHVRTGAPELRDAVISNCMLVRSSETGGTTLLLGKHLLAYILAADLVNLPQDKDLLFKVWLNKCLVRQFPDGKTLRSTHETRPNNWGTFAGASRLAAAIYIEDEEEIRRCADVFKGWLGDRGTYDGFFFKDRSWQAAPLAPVGINPLGATKNGHSIDGVLPDDQRRGGLFTWPPPRENYVYTALQGAVAQAILLERCGYPVWEWEDRALLRAFTWLYDAADYPARGDDLWMIPVINHVYGTNFAITPPFKIGKNLDWTDWVYQSSRPDEP